MYLPLLRMSNRMHSILLLVCTAIALKMQLTASWTLQAPTEPPATLVSNNFTKLAPTKSTSAASLHKFFSPYIAWLPSYCGWQHPSFCRPRRSHRCRWSYRPDRYVLSNYHMQPHPAPTNLLYPQQAYREMFYLNFLHGCHHIAAHSLLCSAGLPGATEPTGATGQTGVPSQ